MDHFQYIDGELCAEAVPIRHIADDVGTPFYCYSTATLERHFFAPVRAVPVFGVLGVDNSVTSRSSFGGTAPERVLEAVSAARKRFLN